MTARAAAIVAVLLLCGCATVPRTGSLCSAGPIVLDSGDKLTRSTAEQVVLVNEAGEKICGWRAPS